MDKLAFMLILTLGGVSGSLILTPYCGVFVYYLFAVLRPQFLWEWTLPDMAWSFYLAASAILSTFIWRVGLLIGPQVHSRGIQLPRWNAGHWAMAFFAFWIYITYYMAYSQQAAKIVFDEYVKIFAMFFVASLCIVSIRQMWAMFLMVLLVIGYIAYEMNFIYFATGYMFVYRRGFGGLDNNGAALMLAMGVPLCLFAWDGIRHWFRWFVLGLIPLIMHAVMTSYSRGAMLTLLLLTPLYVMRCRQRQQLSGILLGIAILVPFMAGQEIQERFFSINEHDQDESAQSRFTSWGIAWRMANEKPIFGFGIRNSNLFTYEYGADIPGRTIHSQYLQIAADSGMVGLFAYLLVLGTTLNCLRNVRLETRDRTDHDSQRTYTIACGVEGSLLAFSFGSIFLSLENFELAYILMLMGIQLWSIHRMNHPDVTFPMHRYSTPE